MRLSWIDYTRGIAILLVVFRHTMVGLERAGMRVPQMLYFSQEMLVNVRMPLFFLISGVFMHQSLWKRTTADIIKNRWQTILYPYFIWCFILISLQILFSDFTNAHRTWRDYRLMITQPRELDHMWYLLALFNCTLLFLLLRRLFSGKAWPSIVVGLIMHFCFIPFRDYSLISDIMYHFIFIALGFVAAPYILRKGAEPYRKNMLLQWLMLLPLFAAGQIVWLRSVDSYYEPYKAWYLIYLLAIILFACWIIYLTSRLLAHWGKLRLLPSIGKESLYIYILHMPIIAACRFLLIKKMHWDNATAVVLLSLLIGTALPVLLHRLVTRFQLEFLFTLKPQTKAV
jgi:fucose 4-O-acetylase-like acetyltransferase